MYLPPLVPGGGGALSLAGEGMGESQLGQGDKHCGTLGIYVSIRTRGQTLWYSRYICINSDKGTNTVVL